jgi:hypothetical protein
MDLLAPLVCIQYSKNRLGSGKSLGEVSWYQETEECQLDKRFDSVPTRHCSSPWSVINFWKKFFFSIFL